MSQSDGPARVDEEFTPGIVLAAYRMGYFPMAESRTGPVSWYCPDPRAIIPLSGFNLPRSLRKELRTRSCLVTVNQAFERVIHECAERGEAGATWISDEIMSVYGELHHLGFAHSLETWVDGRLMGGLYGVAVGGAFFGESMFSRVSNMSKFALVHLVDRLRARGFALLDTQIINDHIRQFGAIEIPREEYLRRLRIAVSLPVKFFE